MLRAAVSRAVQLLSTSSGPQPIRSIEPKFTKLFINNAWMNSSAGGTIGTFNPANGKLITEVEEADRKDVDLAVQAATSAFAPGSPWRCTDGERRGQLLHRLADLMERDRNILASLESLDSGKPFTTAYDVDLSLSIECIRYYADCACEMGDASVASGPCGELVSWHSPLLRQTWKLAPALAAGNTIVMKLSERTPLSGLHMASLIEEADFPEGVVNIIVGYAATVARALVTHPGLTINAPREAKRAAGRSETGQNVPVEFDGRSPNIVFADSDLEDAVDHAHHGIFFSNGRCWCAGSRTFVEGKVYDEFVDRSRELAERLILGDPFEPSTQQGPQVDGHHVKEILRHVESGKRDGAHLVTGGTKWGDRGHYVLPTVFANVDDHMSIAQEEIVGPVMKAIRFDSMEDLLKKSAVIRGCRPIAVITQDADKAKHVATNIKSRSVWINPIDGASLAEFQLSEATPRKAADGFKAFRSGRVIRAQSR